MLPEDYSACSAVFYEWRQDFEFKTQIVGLLSPNEDNIKQAEEQLPFADFVIHTKQTWNLDHKPSDIEHDIIIANNVFHYSQHPEKWFQNVFDSCREFWMQDLFIRHRGTVSELGNDGDAVRYSLGDFENKYPLPIERVLDYYAYDAGSFANKRTSINFVARLKGDL